MLTNRSDEASPAYGFLLLITAGIVSSWSPGGHADEFAAERATRFDRVDAETIKMHTRQILSEPALASRTTPWQWFRERLGRWRGPHLELGSGWATFAWYVILIWCILTLLAIFVHLIWTIRLVIWPNARGQNATAGPGSEPVETISFEELCKIARELAEKGAFCEAISTMILGLLCWLDSTGTIRFHRSKTNGDYVREYPSDLAGWNEFRQFVLTFEQRIYGSAPCDHQTFWQMNALMECIREGITKKA